MLRCSLAGNEKTNIFVAQNFSGEKKHTSEVPFITVWQFAGIHKCQEAFTQMPKIYIGRTRD
jgi:hypothetical protein